MAVPFRRTSKTKKRMRRTHFKLAVSGLVACAKCGAMVISHRVCPNCGYYDGKKILELDMKGKEIDKKETKKAAKKEAKKGK